jgi:hypothetical protein
MAAAWHDTAFPVPVHAAITGESMEESRVDTTVMDKNRRILQNALYPLFCCESNGISAVGRLNRLILSNASTGGPLHDSPLIINGPLASQLVT